MADDDSKQGSNDWPLPKFCFELNWGGEVMSFQEVSGLDVATHPLEYRAGDSKTFSVVKMPGIRKYSNVTLRKGVFKGVFKGDAKFWDRFAQSRLNDAQRVSVTIRLLDEAGKATMVWTMANAWPAKVSGTDLKASGDEVAIESIEIAHEGITIGNG